MPKTTALEAYWNFFERFNTRDSHEFSSALNYPHVRVTWRDSPSIFADAEAHALNTAWDQLIANGWDHTEGITPKVVHSSPTKAHIVGGWTRVTASGQPILVNRVCYIVTKVEGSWGIQCRFGTDAGGNDAEMSEERQVKTLAVAGQFLNALAEQVWDDVWDSCTDEFLEISVARVERRIRDDKLKGQGILSSDAAVVQSGPHSATVALQNNEGAVLLYLVDDSGWKIKAGSWI